MGGREGSWRKKRRGIGERETETERDRQGEKKHGLRRDREGHPTFSFHTTLVNDNDDNEAVKIQKHQKQQKRVKTLIAIQGRRASPTICTTGGNFGVLRKVAHE